MIFKAKKQRRFYIVPRKQSTVEESSHSFANRTKPRWVLKELLYLKAMNPSMGCRHIAHLFNRRFAVSKRMTVSKSYVYEKLKQHKYEIQILRRKIKHRRPKAVKINHCWGVDLATVTDQSGIQNTVLAMVDYGSRSCVCLQHLNSKHSIKLLLVLFNTMKRYGKPRSIKTDNEACFTSITFRLGLNLLGIKHQRSDVACPWQNGRVERFIGTFKSKIRQVIIKNTHQLQCELREFVFYYNVVRPHDYLDGRTPYEVWHQIDVFKRAPKRIEPYHAWDGVLTGEQLLY
ncbi:integrase core domain-containing protein [Marinomonas sp. 2405UD66-6]|uniref:integrase core domain-containing protein n=1 Tax=Marinomonas sp. 2405UD66-6 TaxID=3391834 RepID=UPI0039C93328